DDVGMNRVLLRSEVIVRIAVIPFFCALEPVRGGFAANCVDVGGPEGLRGERRRSGVGPQRNRNLQFAELRVFTAKWQNEGEPRRSVVVIDAGYVFDLMFQRVDVVSELDREVAAFQVYAVFFLRVEKNGER